MTSVVEDGPRITSFNKTCKKVRLLLRSVIKPGPAGFNKRQVEETAWSNPGDPAGRPGRTRTRPGFFFLMWDLKPINIYTLFSQEKSHVFSMWDKKPFCLNTST
jgi:hypothetical protein